MLSNLLYLIGKDKVDERKINCFFETKKTVNFRSMHRIITVNNSFEFGRMISG